MKHLIESIKKTLPRYTNMSLEKRGDLRNTLNRKINDLLIGNNYRFKYQDDTRFHNRLFNQIWNDVTTGKIAISKMDETYILNTIEHLKY